MYKHIKRNSFIVPPPPTIPPHFTVTYIHSYTYTHIHLSSPVGCHAIQPVGYFSTTLRATSEGSMTKEGLAIADKSGLTR
jgi:hypothetical protein